MELAISFSDIDLSAGTFRTLEIHFSIFEGTARLASDEPALPSQLRTHLPDGGRMCVDLHPEFPCVELPAGSEAEAEGNSSGGLRVWRPPLEFVPPADREWLRRAGLLEGRRAPPVLGRYVDESGWRDPRPRDVDRICDALDYATRRVVARRTQAA